MKALSKIANGVKDYQPSDLEASFMYHWRVLVGGDLPEPVPQYAPIKGKKYRLDFCFPKFRLGIELQGVGGGGYGVAVKCHNCGATVRARKKDGSLGKQLRMTYPGHASGAQMARDAEKNNALVEAGWKVLVFTSLHLEKEPTRVIEQVSGLLRRLEDEEEEWTGFPSCLP